MTINNETISKALTNLVPDAEWVLSGDDYSELNWLSDGTPPTMAEIEAEIELLPIKEKNALLELQKNKEALLSKLGITAEEAILLLS